MVSSLVSDLCWVVHIIEAISAKGEYDRLNFIEGDGILFVVFHLPWTAFQKHS